MQGTRGARAAAATVYRWLQRIRQRPDTFAGVAEVHAALEAAGMSPEAARKAKQRWCHLPPEEQ